MNVKPITVKEKCVIVLRAAHFLSNGTDDNFKRVNENSIICVSDAIADIQVHL